MKTPDQYEAEIARLRTQLAEQRTRTQEALYYHLKETEPRQEAKESAEDFALRRLNHREFFHARSQQLTGQRLPDVNPWEE